MKQKISYKCSSCTYSSIKWIGCCPECKEWDSMQEVQPLQPIIGAKKNSGAQQTTMVQLSSVDVKPKDRMLSGIKEWDRVLGNGIMPSSLLILTGDPGIGKSTLLLQISNNLAANHTVFYFSTEESLQQVKMRAQRLAGKINDKLMFSDDANLENIIATAQLEKPDL